MSNLSEWKIKKVNDIESNPIDCYWAIGKIKSQPRLYTIIEQYPTQKDGYTNVPGSEPELYILFESIQGRHRSDCFDGEGDNTIENWKYATLWGDYFFKDRGSFVHAYKTLDEAKARAEIQLETINGIIQTYFPAKHDSLD